MEPASKLEKDVQVLESTVQVCHGFVSSDFHEELAGEFYYYDNGRTGAPRLVTSCWPICRFIAVGLVGFVILNDSQVVIDNGKQQFDRKGMSGKFLVLLEEKLVEQIYTHFDNKYKSARKQEEDMAEKLSQLPDYDSACWVSFGGVGWWPSRYIDRTDQERRTLIDKQVLDKEQENKHLVRYFPEKPKGHQEYGWVDADKIRLFEMTSYDVATARGPHNKQIPKDKEYHPAVTGAIAWKGQVDANLEVFDKRCINCGRTRQVRGHRADWGNARSWVCRDGWIDGRGGTQTGCQTKAASPVAYPAKGNVASTPAPKGNVEATPAAKRKRSSNNDSSNKTDGRTRLEKKPKSRSM